ncbi:unnamed protein product [Candidula unifasciata]|uniref:Nuclear respiratory factor 1 NLS/DNA-binding dimerisation domain-containing protein n=1 Tax=Candidula unifasciata TaxID=100452 RepID=A0A8S3YS06_9EUPU|nr:unnamed protein product [Candidula unifasciata]
MDHGKDLPPLTLNNTSASCLVTLIPVLVSMTSHSEIPCYDDETDKPAWWPSDIEWRNPQFYLEDADRRNDCLKVLRKLVYSCYSYHGVEDLCRLEETPVSDMENMEIIQLAEDSEALEDSSAESEGPVYVCCFCLNQFSSHHQVNAHQNICSKRFNEVVSVSPTAMLPDDTQMDSVMEPVSARHCFEDSPLGASDYPASSPDSESSYINDVASSESSLATSHMPKVFTDVGRTSSAHSSSASSRLSQVPHNSALSTSNSSSLKRPGPVASAPFLPTLKTRSQKRLDQIKERHKSRRLMIEECQQMRGVPQNGAWWTGIKRRKCSIAYHSPNRPLSQDAFVSALGLARATDVAAMAEKNSRNEQEVDLDCEIISVEGPLSAVPPPPPPPPPPEAAVEKTSASPRSTRSLISQLGRDNEVTTRRRLSFCFVEDEWADREALNEGRDPLQISLLTLDLSSPLGLRVKKYVRGEGHLNIIKDVESYCRTEMDEDGYSKLRFRGCDFRITYRKKKRASNYVHTYKFNKSDRLEFKTLLKTGLSMHSRHIQQALPLCKVVLNRLSKSQIKLWTEEKKITISEQIVYDDDICITHIDIPESKITQGFTSDAQSPSQHQLHRKTQYLAQSSPVSVGRQCSTPESRLSLSSRVSASPPHVPNIFRNRTSFTSSPPHPTSVPRPSSLSSGWRPQHATQKTNRSIGDMECSQFNSLSPSVNNSGRQNILDKTGNSFKKTEANLSHLTGHKSLSPSPYAVPGTSASESRNSGEMQGTNRRKQQLTQLRKDDGDGGASNSATSTDRNFVPYVNHNSSLPLRNRGLTENNHSNPMQKHKEHHSSGIPLQPSTRKLSNFDYFSIRDGKIQPSYPHNSHPLVSQHRPSAPLAPALNPHNRQNTSFHRQPYPHPRPHQHSQPPSPLSHSQHPHPRFKSTLQGAPGQARPCPVHSNNFPQHRLPAGHKRPEGLAFSRNQNSGANNIRPPHQKTVSEKALPAQHLHKKNYLEDDDVMEVICIDDD